MDDSKYQIFNVSKKSRWIYIDFDEWDVEEPDSFARLVKYISEKVGGEIIDIGDTRYKISLDPMNLIYQWDTLFGIVLEYPESADVDCVLDYINLILDEINNEMKEALS